MVSDRERNASGARTDIEHPHRSLRRDEGKSFLDQEFCFRARDKDPTPYPESEPEEFCFAQHVLQRLMAEPAMEKPYQLFQRCRRERLIALQHKL